MLRAIDRLGPAAGITVAALGLVGAVLVPLGWWHPAVVVPIAALIAVGAWRIGPGSQPDHDRVVSSCSRRSARSLALARARPSQPLAATHHSIAVSLAVVFTLWSAVLHSQHVVIRRDGGAYALYTQWIATRHGLPVDADLAAFGGGAAFEVPGFTLSSPAFYQVIAGAGSGSGVGVGTEVGNEIGAQVVPQFLVGAPAVYSLGWWAGTPFGASWTGMQVVPALLCGLALLCLAALVDRLIGARWSPLAVAGLGLALPMALVARTTYSEPAALLVVLAAAVVLVDAVRDRRRDLAAVGGALVGLAGLVRVDAVREVALLVAVCAVLALRGNRVAVTAAASALAGSAVSLGVGWSMSRPYLTSIGPSLTPLLAATVIVVVVAAVAVPLVRRRRAAGRADRWADRHGGMPGRDRGLWPGLATGSVLLLGVVLTTRPLWMTVRQDPDDPGARFVASLQRGQGMPIDGGRTYAEHTVDWVAWYLGWPAVVGAWVVLAILADRAVRWWRSGSADPPAWLVPAVVGFGSSVLVLLRPGITPDHPWAARRLVPVLLPLLVVAAVAGIAWATRQLATRQLATRQLATRQLATRQSATQVTWLRFEGRRAVAAVATVGCLVLLTPVVWATWPLAAVRTEAGEVVAVRQVCEKLGPRDVVVAVEATPDGIAQRSANEWVQVVRGACGRPSAALLTPAADLPDAAANLADLVAGAGGRLVLLTAQEDDAAAQRVLSASGASRGDIVGESPARFGPPFRAVRLETLEDRKLLTRRPPGPSRLVINVWIAADRG